MKSPWITEPAADRKSFLQKNDEKIQQLILRKITFYRPLAYSSSSKEQDGKQDNSLATLQNKYGGNNRNSNYNDDDYYDDRDPYNAYNNRSGNIRRP